MGMGGLHLPLPENLFLLQKLFFRIVIQNFALLKTGQWLAVY